MTGEADARMLAVRDKFIARCGEERAQLPPIESLGDSDLQRIGEAAHVDRGIASHGDVGPAYQRYIAELDRLLNA